MLMGARPKTNPTDYKVLTPTHDDASKKNKTDRAGEGGARSQGRGGPRTHLSLVTRSKPERKMGYFRAGQAGNNEPFAD